MKYHAMYSFLIFSKKFVPEIYHDIYESLKYHYLQ